MGLRCKMDHPRPWTGRYTLIVMMKSMLSSHHDGIEDGTPLQSNTLTISNTPPTTPVVGVTSSGSVVPVEGVDDLVCTVTVPATDTDNDVLDYTYNWYDPYGNLAQSSNSTNLSDTFAGNTPTTPGLWECDVTVSDGSLTAADSRYRSRC